MNMLQRILDYKADEVCALKRRFSAQALTELARAQEPPRGFARSLDAVAAADRNALICEIKRRSPSAGDILAGADAVAVARDYAAGGAACLSVLTDGPSFGGSLADFAAVRDAVPIPVLRKDFMIDPLQVLEAAAFGADCILIIMSAVDDVLARDLSQTAQGLGIDVLVETHDENELDRALRLPSPLIGINNRNLKQMLTDLSTTERLAPLVPLGRHAIAESGISAPDEIRRLRQAHVRRFLIGESLMRRTDRTAFTALLKETA